MESTRCGNRPRPRFGTRNGGRTTPIAQTLRATWGVASLVAVTSLLVGLSAAPGLATFSLIFNLPWFAQTPSLHLVVVGVAFVPSYLVFCVGLMTLSPLACRILGWRSLPGTYDLQELGWPIIRWAQYNACIHLVRLLAGGIFRATGVWSWYVRLSGARVGAGVHINTLALYDHNLLSFGDGVVLGSDVKLSGHITQHGDLVIAPVVLGDRVTVGTNSIVQPGVVVGDGTLVGVMSLVPRDAQLEGKAVYAGAPVKLLRRRGEDDAEDAMSVIP